MVDYQSIGIIEAASFAGKFAVPQNGGGKSSYNIVEIAREGGGCDGGTLLGAILDGLPVLVRLEGDPANDDLPAEEARITLDAGDRTILGGLLAKFVALVGLPASLADTFLIFREVSATFRAIDLLLPGLSVMALEKSFADRACVHRCSLFQS
jgi:hypothetical protein